MRLLTLIAATFALIAGAYMVKAMMFPSSTAAILSTVAAPTTTLSPHEIHLNYKEIKDLPVHDFTNAN
jgi:hypothetical protein